MTAIITAASILALTLVGCGIAGYVRRRQPRRTAPLTTRAPLSSDAQVLHRRLLDALPQYMVLPRVGLQAFLAPPAGMPRLHAIAADMHGGETADFLICDQSYLPIAAVELEDILDRPRERRHVHACLRAAGVPLLRWDAIDLPDVRTIQEAVAEIETMRLISQSRAQSSRQASRFATADGHGRREPKL